MKINILDCTLRDGGYINDWNFKDFQIIKILNSLEKSNADIVECGYLNDKKSKNQDTTLFKDTKSVDKFIENSNDKAQKVVMINQGDYDISKLSSKKTTFIDGLRLAFHKENLDSAIDSAQKIIKLGYKLYFQPMVTKNYTDLEFLSMIEKVNELKPYSFYIVDSFGSMTLDEFHKYLILADSSLSKNVVLGYHSHNNMQLAFSNAVSMCGINLKRDIIIDASIYGVGRGAGNLNTELIADFLNKSYKKSYDTLPLLEIIDELLSSMMKKTPWGFSPAQFLSASYNCHPNYATYLINKNTNHIVGVRKVLEKLPEEKKSSYDKEYIEKLYQEYLVQVKTPIKGDWNIINNKKVLLIASGKSVQEKENLIIDKIDSDEYLVVALNHQPKFSCDYYFFSNQKRFDEFKNLISLNKIIITNNISSDINLDIVIDFKNLAYVNNNFVTNVAIVCLNYLVLNNVNKVEIAGLDGYKVDVDNYSYIETSIINDNKELVEQNRIIQSSLDSLKESIDIDFLTPTIFK